MASADCTLEDAIENIDIGGPAMLRAAAKNWPDVSVLIDPADYPRVLAELRDGAVQRDTRFMLAKKVYAHTAAYDGMIANYLGALASGAERDVAAVPAREAFPGAVPPASWRGHRRCATARTRIRPRPSIARAGRAMGCWRAGRSCRARNSATTTSPMPTRRGNASGPSTRRAVSSSNTPTPAAWPWAASLVEAYAKAWQTDPTSAYGGILAFNRRVDEATARQIGEHKQFVEVLIAPGFSRRGARNLRQQGRTCACWSVPMGGAAMRWTSSASVAACCCRRPT